MVPRLTKGGGSFRGAALYYLHDKRQEGEKIRLTTARVAWTETINLPTDSPERAWRMMADTASQQGALKTAAGIKATGRKLENPVLAYSLSWHPDEKPDRAAMHSAALESLKVLGLEDHQVLLVTHQDEPHPHIHLIVNRVNPNDGRAAALSKSKLALSKWAEDYEHRQGLVRCEERVKNNAARDVRKQFDRAGADKRPRSDFRKASNDHRGSFQARKVAAAATKRNRLRAEELKLQQRAKDRALSERSKALYARHRQEWKDLTEAYNARKTQIAAMRERAVKIGIAKMKEDGKGDWRKLYQRQRKSERAFMQRERSTLGRAWNIVRLVTNTPVSQHTQDHRGNLARAFNLMLSKGRRLNALHQAQEWEKKALSGKSYESIKTMTAEIRRIFREEHHRKAWGDFQTQRTGLVDRQNAERGEIRQAWADRKGEREGAWSAFREEQHHAAEHDRQQDEARQQQRDAAMSRVRSAFGRSTEEGRDRDTGGRERPPPGSTPPPSKPGSGKL